MEITSAGTFVLPYRAGAAWAEREILAGRPVSRDHELTIHVASLPLKLRKRAEAVAAGIWFPAFGLRTPLVHGTGVDSQCAVWNNGQEEPDVESLADPIYDEIGRLPEIPEPTSDAAAVIGAYEEWMKEFTLRSLSALSAWANKWADEDESLQLNCGVDDVAWKDKVSFRKRGNGVAALEVDARTDLAVFQQLRAAKIHHKETKGEVDAESWRAANDVAGGESVTFDPRIGDLPDLVEAYAKHLAHFDQLALAYNRARAATKFDFDQEAERWSSEHGSERLRMGLADGFRMISVYLEERLALEMPGAYAHQPKADEKAMWQSRVAPTELALQLRRAVQDRLDEHAPPGQEPAKATIVWMKDIPDPMETSTDQRGNYIGRHQQGDYEPNYWEDFEAVLVENWLGRYHLIGPVHTNEHPLPELVNRWLKPGDYGLEGPRRAGMWEPVPVFASDDDIPF